MATRLPVSETQCEARPRTPFFMCLTARPAWARLPAPSENATRMVVDSILQMALNTLVRVHRRALLAAFESQGWDPAVLFSIPGSDRPALLEHVFSVAHSQTARCRRLSRFERGSSVRRHEAKACNAQLKECSSCLFNTSMLPYRWLPGLPVRSVPSDHYRIAARIEVMHVFDTEPGAFWMYGAPGSGVWWDPGRRFVARNLVSALLSFHPMERIIAHLVRPRNTRLRAARNYAQWRAAFGNTSWEVVLQNAARGDPTYSIFASASDLLGGLLHPAPTSIDSLILTDQTHYWPRWGEERFIWAPKVVQSPCTTSAGVLDRFTRGRIHAIPEIVDFRIQTAAATGGWSRRKRVALAAQGHVYKFLASDSSGQRGCGDAGDQQQLRALCTSCSMAVKRLCRCALEASDKGGAIVSRHFNTAAARHCCIASELRDG